jgi:hypothetical protein
MTTEITDFSMADAVAPVGGFVPTARELQAVGVIGLDMGRASRTILMNRIGAILGMPVGGWHGQARLFEDGDIRLRWLLRRFALVRQAAAIAGNVARAARFVHVDLALALISAAREYDQSLTATGAAVIDTYDQGGLDFLEKQKAQLGLPRSVLRAWQPAPQRINDETHNRVYPEFIPAHDQLLAYAAQLAASFSRNFQRSLRAEFGERAEGAIVAASRASLLVWRAYAFLAPGGGPYDPTKPVARQLGQHFGHRSALQYFVHLAAGAGRNASLDDILTDKGLDHLEWIHSAKTRAAEALFIERLLKRARELLPR